MNREIILVEVVTKSDMSTEKAKAFSVTENAEKYFCDLIKEVFPTIEQDDLNYALDDGYFDYSISEVSVMDKKSVIIKEVTFEDNFLSDDEETNELDNWFDEYDTDTITVSDFDIKYKGILIDNVHRGVDGKISIWAGNPDTDKYAEELLPNEQERKEIFNDILENLN